MFDFAFPTLKLYLFETGLRKLVLLPWMAIFEPQRPLL